jgi:hypothetical protein
MTHSLYNFVIPVNGENNMKYVGIGYKDDRQPCSAAKKGKKRLRLLQKVNWGANLDTLALTYKTYIKPAIEYGTEIFPAAAAIHSNKIGRVQNQALRLITGGLKTLPVEAMEWYTQAETLHHAIRLH